MIDTLSTNCSFIFYNFIGKYTSNKDIFKSGENDIDLTLSSSSSYNFDFLTTTKISELKDKTINMIIDKPSVTVTGPGTVTPSPGVVTGSTSTVAYGKVISAESNKLIINIEKFDNVIPPEKTIKGGYSKKRKKYIKTKTAKNLSNYK